MKNKHFVALVAMVALLAFAATALAASGTLTTTLYNKAGVTINGTVVAKMGTTTKTCATAAGKCSLTLTTGTWKVSAVTSAGATAGPVNKVVQTGSNALTLTFN
jgi:hypothetical protein